MDVYRPVSTSFSTLYKVTNVSSVPLHILWTPSLLSDENRKKYETFKNTNAYTGEVETEKKARLKQPEYERMIPFLETIQIGARKKHSRQRGEVSEQLGWWGWCLAPDWKEFITRDIEDIVHICQEYFVFPEYGDDKSVLADKLKKVIGESNETVLSGPQFDNVKHLITKEIVQTPVAGVPGVKIYTEGLLKFEKIDPTSIPKVGAKEDTTVSQKEDTVSDLSYAELKAKAKELGLPFVGVKAEKLKVDILNAMR
jgi:hypothetical protein